MLSIHTTEDLVTKITGEFWDFDRLYFAISKLTGDYGIDTPCPFPGYDSVCENLLGLNYELRHAMQGDRGVTEHYTGIPEYWIAPAGPGHRIRQKDQPEPDPEKMNIELFDERIMLMLPEEMEWDEFTEMDADEMIDFLIDLGFDYDECEEYVEALEEENAYRFPRSDLPHFSGYNSYLSLELPLSEVVFYALILQELLPQKEAYAAHCKRLMDENVNGLGDIHRRYYFTDMHVDLARMELFSWMVLDSLYRILDKDYPEFMDRYNQKPVRFLHADLRALNELVVKYAKCEDGLSAKDTMRLYLEAFLEETRFK